ncbi:hypothetical protein D3C76_1200180 [compost metagenome]
MFGEEGVQKVALNEGAIEHHHVGVAQILGREGGLAGIRMVGVHACKHLVAAQQDGFLVGWHAPGLQQRQVDFPLFQAVANVFGTAFEYGHGDARVQLAKGVHQPGHVVQAKHRRNAQAHFAALQVGHVAQFLAGNIHFAQGRSNPRQKLLAFGG